MTGLPMTENDLLATVLEMAAARRIRTAHFRPARTEKGWRTAVSGDGKGWPDLLLCGRRFAVRELKSDTGVLSPDQRLWIAALELAGIDVAVWTVADLRSGRIDAELRDIAPTNRDRVTAGTPLRRHP